jgi:hypothetical protein
MPNREQGIAADANPLAAWIQTVTEVTENMNDYVTVSEIKAKYRVYATSAEFKHFKKDLVTSYFRDIPGVLIRPFDKCRPRDDPSGKRKTLRDVIRFVKSS